MQAANQRFLPLDVFRGLTICFMIIVNTPGSYDHIFAPLEHAAWHGFTPTDLVFPSFLFAVGNAMSFSMRKYFELGDAAVLSKIFKRTLLIFLLGFIMYWLPFVRHTPNGLEFIPFHDTRIMGVLERIALCYCFASLMIRYLPTRAVWVISGILLLGYWAIMYFLGDPADPYGFGTNAAVHFDKLILGENHMYHDKGTISEPEGLLSTLPAIVNVVIGYYTGLFIQKRKPNTFSILIRFGSVFIIVATLWNQQFPINKKLWTSSFVLLTAGLDLLILTALLYIIDVKGKTKWTGFFTTFGKNPLFLYLLSEVMVIFLYFFTIGNESVYEWISNHIFQLIAPGKVGSLLFAISFMLFCWCVGKILDKKRIYVRV